MKLALTTTVAAVLSLAVAGTAIAEEILLNSGSGIEGEITSVDQESMKVKTEDGKNITLLRGAVDPHFYYSAWKERMEQTAENHLRVAVFAFENGLFNQARSQYRQAQRKDKELVKKFEEEIVPEIKEGVAEKLLAMAQAAVAAKDYRRAETIASKLLTRLENTAAAAEARDLIASVHLWEMDNDQQRLAKRLARHLPKDEAKAVRDRDRIVNRTAPIERRLDTARRSMTRGLRETSATRSRGHFRSAAKEFERQVKALDKLIEDAGEDTALVEYLNGLREIGVREGVDAWIAAGNVDLSRSSFQNALEAGNNALALDAESAKAQKFVAEVRQAEQYNNGWFTTYARGGRPGAGRARGGGRRR